MSRIKIAYIISLVILGVLVAFTVFKPVVANEEYSEVQRAQLLESEDQWIIELHILSHEVQDTDYNICVFVDEQLITEHIRLRPGELFKHIHHISRDKEREVSITVYKEGQDSPLEQATYYLK
ncbi:hypothetical protein ACFLYR_07045 [Chloroflexota bacterium]